MINVKNYLTVKYNMMFVTLEEFFLIQWKENGVEGIGSFTRVTNEILFDSARLEHIHFTYQAAELKEKSKNSTTAMTATVSLEKSLCILQNFSAITPSYSSLKPQSFCFFHNPLAHPENFLAKIQ